MRAKIVSRPSHLPRLRLNLPPPALDISADLPELTRCPVALVSAGVKSILDIGRFVFCIYLGDPWSHMERIQDIRVSRQS